MCIRDRPNAVQLISDYASIGFWVRVDDINIADAESYIMTCLLYTSDAADERSSVDLGGRGIIKKNNTKKKKKTEQFYKYSKQEYTSNQL